MNNIIKIPENDVQVSFLFSILIHMLILSIPLYFPETKYLPMFEITPVEVLNIETIETKKIIKKQILEKSRQSLQEASNFSQLEQKASSFKANKQFNKNSFVNTSPMNAGGKDFGKLNILDSKKSDILIKKESSFIPSEKRDYGPSGSGKDKSFSNMEGIGEKDIFPGIGEGDKLTPYSPSLSSGTESDYGFDFGGTIGKRGVRSKPSQKPVTEIEREVIILLKFWVTPSGQVFDVAPERKGEAYLEKVAIDYIRKWTFDPLPSSAVQQNQWGIIPIRFEKK